MWGIKIVATKRPGHSTLRQHILNNQLEENGSNVQNGQNGHFSIFAFISGAGWVSSSSGAMRRSLATVCLTCLTPTLMEFSKV